MSNSNSYKVILESRGNKFCIYYKNSAIYCKTVDFDGRVKESILIDSVYDNFLYSKSQEDNIYLLCQGRNKNFLLFIFDGEGWHMEELYLRKELGSIIPLSLFALTDGIHIIYAKKLSVEYYYDLFQLRKSKNEWEKNFICEIYSKAKGFSLDIKMTDYNMLHMISTLYNGETSSLNYYNYTVKNEQWVYMPIVNLSHSNIFIKTLLYNDSLHLFCYSFDNDNLNLFYFTKYLKGESSFSLIDIIKISSIQRNSDMVMDILNDTLIISYINNNTYFENHYNILFKKWEKSDLIPLGQLPALHYTKIITDSCDSNLEEKEVICSISDKLDILMPFNQTVSINENDLEEKNINSKTAALLLDHINLLTEKIEALDKKINKYEDKEFYNDRVVRREAEGNISRKPSPPILKESNFKENFMKYKPASLKLDSSAMILPAFSDTPEEKKEEVSDIKEKSDVIEKQKGIMKAVSEWFK